jgi:hypothetical protein
MAASVVGFDDDRACGGELPSKWVAATYPANRWCGKLGIIQAFLKMNDALDCRD